MRDIVGMLLYAIVLILCSPMGWIGMIIVALAVGLHSHPGACL